MSSSTYSYSDDALDTSDMSLDVLVTGKEAKRDRPRELPSVPRERRESKPREVNRSTRARRDIQSLRNDFMDPPSDKLVIRMPVASEKELRDVAERSAAQSADAGVLVGARSSAGAVSATHSITITDTGAKIIIVKKASPLPTIIFSIIFTTLMMYLVFLGIKVDDYTSNIGTLKAELSDIREEETRLALSLDAKFNLAQISKIAQEEYGMVSADSLPKKYITLTGEDYIEIVKPESGSGFDTLLSAFSELLGDIYN